MQCNEVRSLLIDYADDLLSDEARAMVGDHLDECRDCEADFQSIVDLQLQSKVWHDVAPPRWQPPRVTPQVDLSGLQQWFPTLASAIALVLVVGMYLQMPSGGPRMTFPAQTGEPSAPLTVVGGFPDSSLNSSTAGSPAGIPAAYREPGLDLRFSNNRLQRQQELQALVQLLRAEMDRRNEETEESLRYVIAHQLQGQREIDDLYQYIQKVGFAPGRPGEKM